MHSHTAYCMSGDHTIEATEHAVNAMAAEDADEAIVIVLSDANLSRYDIRPAELSTALTSKEPKVQAYAIFIGSRGNQAQKWVCWEIHGTRRTAMKGLLISSVWFCNFQAERWLAGRKSVHLHGCSRFAIDHEANIHIVLPELQFVELICYKCWFCAWHFVSPIVDNCVSFMYVVAMRYGMKWSYHGLYIYASNKRQRPFKINTIAICLLFWFCVYSWFLSAYCFVISIEHQTHIHTHHPTTVFNKLE